jgi:hypothetical protein
VTVLVRKPNAHAVLGAAVRDEGHTIPGVVALGSKTASAFSVERIHALADGAAL